MKTYEIEIEGISPIVCNTRQKEIDDEIKKLKKDELAEWEEKNWRRKAVTNDNGKVILRRSWFRGMLINSAKGTRLIPHFATTKSATFTKYLGSTFVDNDPVLGDIKEFQPYGDYVDGNPSSSKGSSKVWKIRPMLKKWKVVIKLHDPFGRMEKSELKELLEYGGFVVGVGDARKLRYGRFKTNSIKEV